MTPSPLSQLTRRTLLTSIAIFFVARFFWHTNDAVADIPNSTQEARVISVIDGDTIVVEINRRRENVRLIGIDTPETRPNHRAELQAHDRHLDQNTILKLGHRASEHTRQLIPKNSTVYLEFDVTKRDRYQRLLAYAWVRRAQPAPALMVNEEILRAGYAYLLSVPPNVKYRARFAAAFKEARSKKNGLWGN